MTKVENCKIRYTINYMQRRAFTCKPFIVSYERTKSKLIIATLIKIKYLYFIPKSKVRTKRILQSEKNEDAVYRLHMCISHVMRKPTNCKGERKTDSTLPLLSNSQVSSLQPSPVLVQPGLCRTCSKTTLLLFS